MRPVSILFPPIRGTLLIGSPRRAGQEIVVRLYFLILVILEPCGPRPAINPFWPKMNA
jgi:hypothetical protein